MSSSDSSNNLLKPLVPIIFGYGGDDYNLPPYLTAPYSYSSMCGFRYKTQQLSSTTGNVTVNGIVGPGVWYVTAQYNNLQMDNPGSGVYLEITLAFRNGNNNADIPTFYDLSGNSTSEFLDASNNNYSPLQTCTPYFYKNGFIVNGGGSSGSPISMQVSGYFYNPNITPGVDNNNSLVKTWISSGSSDIISYTDSSGSLPPANVNIIAVRVG